MGTVGDGSVEEPINREPDAETLTNSFLTPSKSQSGSKHIAYERNHGPIQHLDGDTHKLTIKSDASLSAAQSTIVGKPINTTFSISDLSQFHQHDIVAALQCAGNRRHSMRARLDEVQGIDWGNGAVMNAQWGGVLLRDVLERVGVQAEDGRADTYDGIHVQFHSSQPTQEDDYYGASIPLSVAMDAERECLLATHMNGSPLTPEHGYPLRVIVPGIIGARSVKWLDGITLAAEESSNHYQKRDYKILKGDIAQRIQETDDEEEKGRIMQDEVKPMGDNPINCVVAVPSEKSATLEKDEDGRVMVKGYAIPQGKDGPVMKVEVSIDRGNTWHEASILDDGDENTTHPSNKGTTSERGKFSWVLWDCHVPVDGEGDVEDVSIWSKATDRGGNTMDMQHPEGEWNLRGVGFNAVEGRRGVKIV
ncbi:hypothetical protein H2200_009707 [Cladophialophora chaetospira]|uniref:Sulfite oxidase n=1 Tax=Cladophialophora chaetospira TaxID=386627 RepID=A0AA39CEZ6_9EURO|nr:hypothetical protein H2200_009707 [Cladophialophora chaetospira]